MTFEIIATIVSAVLGSTVLSTLITGFFAKKKTDADAATMTVDSILKWATTLTSRIDALERALKEKDDLIAELKARVVHLEASVDK